MTNDNAAEREIMAKDIEAIDAVKRHSYLCTIELADGSTITSESYCADAETAKKTARDSAMKKAFPNSRKTGDAIEPVPAINDAIKRLADDLAAEAKS